MKTKINSRSSKRAAVLLVFAGLTLLATASRAQNVTVNPNPATYPNLQAAFAAINNGVHTGVVIVSIVGNTTENSPAVLNASGTGAASYTSILIVPVGGARTITGTVTGALINLNGANHVTIDGSTDGTSSRDLTINNTGPGAANAVVWLQSVGGVGGAANNIVKNVNLVGNTTTLVGIGAGSNTISITSAGLGNNNNTFQNCNISRTQYGIYSGGASVANSNTGNVISGNLMNTPPPNNVSVGGILVRFERGVQITGNAISGMSFSSSFTPTTFGIALGATPANTTTNFTGNDVTDAAVTRNSIGAVSQSGAGSSFGIIVNSVPTGTTLIANNMISGVTSNSTPSDFSAGILAGGGAGSTTLIYYNSVSMTDPRGTASMPSYALAVGGSNPLIDIRNNIFFNAQTSTTNGKSYAIGLAYAAPYSNLTSNNNDLLTIGAQAAFAQVGGLGTAGTDRATLAAWRAETGKDANSISADPLFVSATDLHLSTPSSPANGAATPLPGIGIDFDGENRDGTTPDIGADEVGLARRRQQRRHLLLRHQHLLRHRHPVRHPHLRLLLHPRPLQRHRLLLHPRPLERQPLHRPPLHRRRPRRQRRPRHHLLLQVLPHPRLLARPFQRQPLRRPPLRIQRPHPLRTRQLHLLRPPHPPRQQLPPRHQLPLQPRLQFPRHKQSTSQRACLFRPATELASVVSSSQEVRPNMCSCEP